MRILITNDDGIKAEGIYALAKEMEKQEDLHITIVAPENQRSAQSHAITLHKPLIIKKVELEGLKSEAYSVSGTPADCVRAAIEAIVDDKIDMVLSGINLGLNAGMDIIYSGTVSAAVEANIYKIPSLAVSAQWMNGTANYELAAKYATELLKKTKDKLLDSNLVLNLNTPYQLNQKDQKDKLKVCKVGGAIHDYYFIDKKDTGESTLTLKGRKETKLEEDTDRYYLSKGYATLTPLYYNLTSLELIEEVKTWLSK